MGKSHIKNFFGVVGMFASMLLIGYSWATTVSDMPPIFADYRYGIGFGILLFFISTFFAVYRLYGKFLWHEPDIEIFTYPKDFFPPKYFYKTATLEIKNNEELPITRCFATLEIADDVHISNDDVPSAFSFVPSIKPSQRIRWEEELEMSENYEMTIMGGASRHISVGSFKNMFYYHVQEGDIENQRNFGIPVHTVKIRIDGYFSERQMKPLFFEGYIYAANLTPPDDFIARKGKLKEWHETLQDRIHNLRMVFKSGNWMEDEEVKKYMDVEEYKTRDKN